MPSIRPCGLLRFLILLAATLFAPAARATFHLWQISEVYSDAGGTVQYIEFSTAFGGQQFLAGHVLTSTQGTSTKTFTFPTDLPGDTANRRFLVGTQGFAALGLVTPDYVVPNGFLFLTNGTIDFVGADLFSYASLPAGGIQALARNGTTVLNRPANFSGAVASISSPQIDCLFSWAERTYPAIFAPGAPSQTVSPWYYRYYSTTNNYLGASALDGHIYYLDSAGLLDVGAQGGWFVAAGCP